MGKLVKVAATLAAALVGLNAQAWERSIPVDDEIIKSVKIELLSDVSADRGAIEHLGWENDCSKNKNLFRPSEIDPGDVINIGKQVWDIVRKNEPVLEAKTMSAHALPRGITCWDELSNWSVPRAQTYQITYTNLYNMDVIKFKFRLLYTYGGRYKGVGNYLTNSTIQYSDISVVWGYIFNANVEIPQVINMGSEGAPIAGMQMTINWSVATRPINLKKSLSSISFFVGGDGRGVQILD